EGDRHHRQHRDELGARLGRRSGYISQRFRAGDGDRQPFRVEGPLAQRTVSGEEGGPVAGGLPSGSGRSAPPNTAEGSWASLQMKRITASMPRSWLSTTRRSSGG